MNTSLKFRQISKSMSDNWTTPAVDGHSRCGLCSEGFREYLDLPDDCFEFTAEFTSQKPAGDDFFELKKNPGDNGGGYTLAAETDMGLYGSALRLLGEMYQTGYRYLRVSY